MLNPRRGPVCPPQPVPSSVTSLRMPPPLSASCPTPSEHCHAPKHTGKTPAKHHPDRARHQKAAYGREAQACFSAPQPPCAGLHLCSGNLPNSSALAQEPTNRTLLPLPQSFGSLRSPDAAARGSALPALARTPPGQEGHRAHALSSQRSSQQGNLDPHSSTSQLATLQLLQHRRRRQCPQPPGAGMRNGPTNAHASSLRPSFPERKPHGAPTGPQSGTGAQPRSSTGTSSGHPSLQTPYAQGSSRRASTAPALTYPALAADRCPGRRAPHRCGGPWSRRCWRCRALAFGSGS